MDNTQLRSFGYLPGTYYNTCFWCKVIHTAAKLSSRCLTCATLAKKLYDKTGNLDLSPDIELYVSLRNNIINFVTSYNKEDWESYYYGIACQDTWSIPLEKLGEEGYKVFEDWFEFHGEHPTQEVCAIFAEIEKEYFGKTVEECL